MTPPDPKAFAQSWEAGWNSHDLDRILSHYRPDIVFRSRKALTLMGQGEIRGIDPLRAYWSKALAQQPDLHFKVEEVFSGYGMVVIVYRNHRDIRAVESLEFDDNGQVFRASACHPPE